MVEAKMKHIEIAISQIGVEEIPKGSNAGPQVNQYLKSVGLNPGYSWCMAFVYWCCKEASVNARLIKTGGVLRMWNEVGRDMKHSTPLTGDIFIMDYGKGLGHTGFVERVEGMNIHTIEGNTNKEGSRNGYQVCRRIRTIASCKGFIRI